MGAVIQVDPGGERFIPFAKKKLRLWKDELLRTGVDTIARRIDVSGGTQIYIKTTWMGGGLFKDRIRIVGGKETLFLVDPLLLVKGYNKSLGLKFAFTPTNAGYMAVSGKQLWILDGATGNLSSFDKTGTVVLDAGVVPYTSILGNSDTYFGAEDPTGSGAFLVLDSSAALAESIASPSPTDLITYDSFAYNLFESYLAIGAVLASDHTTISLLGKNIGGAYAFALTPITPTYATGNFQLAVGPTYIYLLSGGNLSALSKVDGTLLTTIAVSLSIPVDPAFVGKNLYLTDAVGGAGMTHVWRYNEDLTGEVDLGSVLNDGGNMTAGTM